MDNIQDVQESLLCPDFMTQKPVADNLSLALFYMLENRLKYCLAQAYLHLPSIQGYRSINQRRTFKQAQVGLEGPILGKFYNDIFPLLIVWFNDVLNLYDNEIKNWSWIHKIDYCQS